MAQRVAYGHVGVMPSFIPVEDSRADAVAQRAMYDFLTRTNQIICETPESIGLPATPDDAYPSFAMQNSRPELIRALKELKKKLDAFYTLLIDIGLKGSAQGEQFIVQKADIAINKRTIDKLAAIGVQTTLTPGAAILTCPDYPDIFLSWKLLAEVSQNAAWPGLPVYPESRSYATVAFSHALFDLNAPCSLGVFRQLLGDDAILDRLIAVFERLGYSYMDIRESALSCDWYKRYGKKETVLKWNWAEREHGGLSVTHSYANEPPFEFGLRIPFYKDLLARFGEMDEKLQAFVTTTGKKCDNCGYCVQTDKTGSRPKQLTVVKLSGKPFAMCHLFPGFQYRWNAMDEGRAEDVIRFLEFCEEVLG